MSPHFCGGIILILAIIFLCRREVRTVGIFLNFDINTSDATMAICHETNLSENKYTIWSIVFKASSHPFIQSFSHMLSCHLVILSSCNPVILS